MPDATVANATIRPGEAAHFAKLAKDWWDPKGSSAMLHRMNPVRLQFIRDAIDAHWDGDPASARPLAGKTALDVGCGAGLLCEPFARLGYFPTLHYGTLWRNTCVVISGAGHAPFWQKPDAFNPLLEQFCDDVAASEVARTERRARIA